MKNKKIVCLTILVTALVLVTFPILLDVFVFGNNLPSNLSNGEWASFLGSYVGAVIGGIVSLIGIALTIQFTREENESAKREQKEKDDAEKKLRILKEKRAQEKELHLMVADLEYHIIKCGEAILIDMNAEKNNKYCNMKFTRFEEENSEMLKQATKLLAYADMRAKASNNERLDFNDVYNDITVYSNKLIDICDEFGRGARDEKNIESYMDQIAQKLSEIRMDVEAAIRKYAQDIVEPDPDKLL